MVRVGSVVRTLILCGLALSTLAFAKTDKSKSASTTAVTHPSAFAVSQPISDLPIDGAYFPAREMPEPRPGPLRHKAAVAPWQQEDPVLQKEVRPFVSATKGVDFDGIPSPGFAPSDSNLAVGPTAIVEVVNVQFAVYNKSGATLAGPTNIQTIFTPLGGDCAAGTDGDPVILYDRQADRWLLSDIGSGATTSECIAVSKTNDPAGAYFLYSYSFGANLNDYPKLSTWPTASNSAYLATYNIFQNFQAFIGADICGYDRAKMLVGDPTAAQLCKMTPADEFSYLPSDMDGPTPPPDGTPGLFITWQNNSPGQLFLRKLTLNFAGGTATLSAATTINVANDTLACGSGGTCVPQPGTTQQLDTLGDRMMYRFAIRHFPDHDRAVLNHSVGNGSSVAIRWYELFDPAGSVTLNQQGTFAPDTTFRWMGSMAEDQNGDIGLGYSAGSSTVHPAIRFTGRIPSDPAGTLESEASILESTGSQLSGLSRWGDYTAMQVDPADDCTFWYVDQYEKVSGTFNWHTSIASFAFSGCGGGGTPNFALSASPGSVTITQGNHGTSTINITPLNGFSGSVTLSATGLPSGVTAAFSPNPATTSSVLTLTASGTATTGTSTVTITGVSGSLTNNTTLSLTVNPVGGAPAVTLSPTSLTWGSIVVGVTSPVKPVTLTNSGSGTLNISNIAISGDFAFTTSTKPCGSTLAAGKNCVLKVTFTPTQVGVRSGNITITDNASGSPQTVPLSGTGSVQATLTPASTTYPARKVGTTSSPKVFTLTNKQAVALNSIAISTTGDFSVSTTTCTSSLAAKAHCTISVVFKPTAVGARTGTLSVSDSATNSPQTASLNGTGQ
jgi:hypothetical protein